MSEYSKDQPFPALLRENRCLNREGSSKDTRHFVVDLKGSGMTYTCGDSLGVVPRNNPESVAALLQASGLDGEALVEVPKVEGMIPLRVALEEKLAIAGPNKKAMQVFAAKATDGVEKAELDRLLEKENSEELKRFLAMREYLDLFEEFRSVRLEASELVSLLRRLVPRLYSIASSPLVYPEEIHLTVAVVRYTMNDRLREGVASTYLTDRVAVGDAPVPVFLSSSHFGIPDDTATDLIMVGPGTGVAPFRAFIQEQKARGGSGRTWLFFGDQHRATDFLYEEEFEAALADGSLSRLETAFSRDQAQKVYVQDRMRECGEELWKWIDGGASFFICGDASRMARDVEAALTAIIMEHGGMDDQAAKAYLKQLRAEKRYQKDVY